MPRTPTEELDNMRGDNALLVLTKTTDPVTGEQKPLFAFACQICKATESKEPKLDYRGPSGGEVDTMYLDTGTSEFIEWDERVPGVLIGEHFRPIDPEAAEGVNKIATDPAIEVMGRMPLAEALGLYAHRFRDDYFLQCPTKGGSPMGYRLVYEALAQDQTALTVRRGSRGREHLYLIIADTVRECLRMIKIEWAAKVREPDAQVLAPTQAAVSQDAINKLRQLVASMPEGGPVLDQTKDRVIVARQALIEEALAMTSPAEIVPITATKATDSLEAQLEASLAALAA